MQLDLYNGLGAAAIVLGVPLLLMALPLALGQVEMWMFRTSSSPAPIEFNESGVGDAEHEPDELGAPLADAPLHGELARLLADLDARARSS